MDSFRLCIRAASAAVVFAAGLAVPAAAAGLCSEPHVPACLSAPGGFDSEEEKGHCRYALDTFLSAVERQANCVLQLAEEEARRHVEQGRREAHEVRDEGREALARFECKVRGNAC